MITPFDINNTAWTPITTAGKSGKCWLDFDNDGAGGDVDIRIAHSSTGVPGDVMTDSPRVFVPNGNNGYFELTPDNQEDIFYSRAIDKDGTARLQVDENAGQAIVPGKHETVRQSNTSPWNDFYFVQANGAPTTLTAAVPTSGDTRILSVASVANISVGDWIGLFSGAPGTEERYYWAEVESINVLDLTMDTLIDFTFGIGSVVLSTTKNMAVDGSSVPQVFAIQAGGGSGDLAIDISRIMMGCLTTDIVDLSKFGDIIGGLLRPMFFRVKENGVYRNKLGFKTNFELALFAYDWNPFATINPQQGQNGYLWRFSIGGEDKHDSVSRVEGGSIGTLEAVIQSNQSTLEDLFAVGANSEVTP